MGFACPVCETPQQDARHLANHLAFTAMVRGDEHEAWLDEHVPGWGEYGEDELAPEVAELAPEADYERVFEDTAHAHGRGGSGHGRGGAGEHAHGEPGPPGGIDPEAAAKAGRGSLDEETRAVLEEARAMTAEMLESESTEDQPDPAESGSGPGESGSEPKNGDGERDRDGKRGRDGDRS